MKSLLFLAAGLLFALPSMAYVDLPEGCWLKSQTLESCAVRAAKREWLQSPGGERLLLGAGSSVIRARGGEEWQVVAGQMWIETEKTVQIRYLQQTFQVQGESWWKRSSSQLKVQVFRGHVSTAFGPVEEVVPSGFENWWESGARGVMKPVLADKVLREWNQWVRFPKAESKKRLEEYQSLWAGRVEQGSDLYQEIVNRRLASIENQEKEAEERRRQAESRQRQMREMFRARYNNP